MIDGLGFEELGQAGSQVASLFMTGSVTTQSNVNVAGTISGAGALYAQSGTFAGGLTVSKAISGQFLDIQKEVTGSAIVDRRGTICSVAMGSGNSHGFNVAAGTYGMVTQAGVSLISDGSECWAIFPKRFGGSYVLSTGFQTLTSDVGSEIATVSGCLHPGSCLLIGQAESIVPWIAVGPGSHY